MAWMKKTVQVFIVFVVISVTVESKNTSETDNNNGDTDMHRKLAAFQDECTETIKEAFSTYDYIVVVAMLAVSLKIGVFYGFCHKDPLESSSDFMLGSQMSLFPVTLSLTTSFVTAIELLGNPAEMFFYGAQFAVIGE